MTLAERIEAAVTAFWAPGAWEKFKKSSPEHVEDERNEMLRAMMSAVPELFANGAFNDERLR